MNGGIEWIVDAFGCTPERLRALVEVEALLHAAVDAIGLTVISTASHVFPEPGGVTALFLLSESHLTIHTFPETGIATINLYCCRPRADFDWAALCQRLLEAREVTVRRLPRGGA